MDVPITLTENAKEQLAKLSAQEDGAVGILLSVAQGRGCGGNEYRMAHLFEEVPGLDKIEVSDSYALYIPVSDSFMMFGMNIDYAKDGIGNENFVMSNPNEKGRCGCGESFSLDDEKLDEVRERFVD